MALFSIKSENFFTKEVNNSIIFSTVQISNTRQSGRFALRSEYDLLSLGSVFYQP